MKNKELNIDELRKQFKEILNSITSEEIANWLVQDEENQAQKLLNGNTIVVENIRTNLSCTIIDLTVRYIDTNEAA